MRLYLAALCGCSLLDTNSLRPQNDASSDANVGSDAGACPGFCDDFDNGPLGARWTQMHVTDGGSLSLDPTDFRSPPNSLFTIVFPKTKEMTSLSYKVPLMNPHKVVIAIDLKIDALDPMTSEIDVLNIAMIPPPANITAYGLGMSTYPSAAKPVNLELYQGFPDGGKTNPALAIDFALGAWHAVVLGADFDADTGSLDVDGVRVAALGMNAAGIPGGATVAIGATYVANANGGQSRVHFDNARISWR